MKQQSLRHIIFVLLSLLLNPTTLFAQPGETMNEEGYQIDESQLVLLVPQNGRLDVDTKTLKDGKNLICQNPETKQLLIAIVENGQIIHCEISAKNTTSFIFNLSTTQTYILTPKGGVTNPDCATITCEQCRATSSSCERCKDCPPSGVDPPILTSEGGGKMHDPDLTFTRTIWVTQTNPDLTLETYSYNYTHYVTIIAPKVFSSMGW